MKKKSIIVTGAGGSIGSTLCETILLKDPGLELILIEHSEFHLFEIYEKLKCKFNKSKITPVLTSLRDVTELQNLILFNKVGKIYNTAAYKHVNMVEQNQLNGITNNLSILRTIVEAVKLSNTIVNLVHVSTDKAVNPINMMGFSKRVCELYIEENNSLFQSVKILRFGNVLESNGSVIPIFKAQINSGGPVTVTSFKATRYFMTIPQACDLIVSVDSLIAENGTFIFDMGENQSIVELAKKLICDSGFQYSFSKEIGTIQIVEIGLRPGEKEHEVLTTGQLVQTSVENVFKASERHDSLDTKIILTLKEYGSSNALYQNLTEPYNKKNG